MASLSQDTTSIPCLRCRKPVAYPAGPAREALRKNLPLVVFCSRLCNLTYVAEQGVKQQEEIVFKETPDVR